MRSRWAAVDIGNLEVNHYVLRHAKSRDRRPHCQAVWLSGYAAVLDVASEPCWPAEYSFFLCTPHCLSAVSAPRRGWTRTKIVIRPRRRRRPPSANRASPWPLWGPRNIPWAAIAARCGSGAYYRQQLEPPVNFTRSRNTDSSPILVSSRGLMHLFMVQDGLDYLYARQLPFPQTAERLTDTGGSSTHPTRRPVALSGNVAPAYQPETVRVCLARQHSAMCWGVCKN